MKPFILYYKAEPNHFNKFHRFEMSYGEIFYGGQSRIYALIETGNQNDPNGLEDYPIAMLTETLEPINEVLRFLIDEGVHIRQEGYVNSNTRKLGGMIHHFYFSMDNEDDVINFLLRFSAQTARMESCPVEMIERDWGKA